MLKNLRLSSDPVRSYHPSGTVSISITGVKVVPSPLIFSSILHHGTALCCALLPDCRLSAKCLAGLALSSPFFLFGSLLLFYFFGGRADHISPPLLLTLFCPLMLYILRGRARDC